MTFSSGHRKRYRAYTGFITTPRYFDDCPQQFLEVAPKDVGVMQRVLHIPDYAYELGQRAKNFDLLEEAAGALAASHVQVIGQTGTNWVHCNGTSPDEIAAICDGISAKIGATFLMAGHCIVEALRAIGAETVTVANGYYRPDWKAGINGYLEAAGITVLYAGNLVDQGYYDSFDDLQRAETLSNWDHPPAEVVGCCVKAHEAAPQADAVVQTGSGMRTQPYVEAIEGLTGKPLVSSDTGLYWAMLKALDLGTPILNHGHLMRTLHPVDPAPRA